MTINTSADGFFFIGALVVPAGESVTSLYQSYDGALVEPSSLKFHVSGPVKYCTYDFTSKVVHFRKQQ